ncbi:hypothetical protein X798_04580 [Onchocerca flexuosa]|uniref:Uncharacterized protein n=1 Tax=Onchocerca flexuosa TaxID=387005 RepID=A0A238BUL7_9BILA|nr:hypothetical protein X798_04580 [Onchocerca flexuosa]
MGSFRSGEGMQMVLFPSTNTKNFLKRAKKENGVHPDENADGFANFAEASSSDSNPLTEFSNSGSGCSDLLLQRLIRMFENT